MNSSTSDVGNVFNRLRGLKNVSGRRVMPGAEVFEELGKADSNQAQPNVVPNFSNFLHPNPVSPPVPPNTPELNRGGSITPKSADVRANSTPQEQQMQAAVQEPVPQQEGAPLTEQESPGFWASIGNKLSNLSGGTKLISNLVQDPVGTVTDKAKSLAWGSGLPTVWEKGKNLVGANNAEPNIEAFDSPFENLVPYGNVPAQATEEQKGQYRISNAEAVQKAIENPGYMAAYGSAQDIAQHPALQATFKEVTGIDYSPQLAEQLTAYEGGMQKLDEQLEGIYNDYGAQSDEITQRIESNTSTDQDKFFIGLSLILPLIVGGVLNKEAGLASFASGAAGLADILGNRDDRVRKDEHSLLDIGKEKANIVEKRAQIPQDISKFAQNIRKNLPKDPNEHLIGQSEIKWKDPETGEERAGVRILPGLVADKRYANTPADLKRMQKAANELSGEKKLVDNVNQISNDVLQVVSQLDDPSIFSQAFNQIVSNKAPSALQNLTQDVTVNGKKVNAGIALRSGLNSLNREFSRIKDSSKTDLALRGQIEQLLFNPTDSFATPDTAINQIMSIRDMAQSDLLNSAKARGFVPEQLIAEMEKANNPIFQGLNKRDDKKELDSIKTDLFQEKLNYGQ